jgi:hypothetical protein
MRVYAPSELMVLKRKMFGTSEWVRHSCFILSTTLPGAAEVARMARQICDAFIFFPLSPAR